MPEITKQQIAQNRLNQPFCASCYHCKIDCQTTERCVECKADFRDIGIKTKFSRRINPKKQDGVPNSRSGLNRKRSKRSAPAWIQ